MNTTLINFESFVEWDNSPFVLFDNQGKIAYLNQSAELLLGFVSRKELYDIALAYATNGFGYKTTNISLCYDNFYFYAITVGYESETHISLRLYITPQIHTKYTLEKENLISTDINLILEANIALFQTQNTVQLHLLADPDLPHLKTNQNNFSKLLRNILQSFSNSETINITLKLLIGKHIIIDNKKEPIAQLFINAALRNTDNDEELVMLADKNQITCIYKFDSIRLEIPLIQ